MQCRNEALERRKRQRAAERAADAEFQGAIGAGGIIYLGPP